MIKPAAGFRQRVAILKGAAPGCAVTQSRMTILPKHRTEPLNVMWFEMTVWCTHTHANVHWEKPCALSTHVAETKNKNKAINMQKKKYSCKDQHTCRWCKHSPCRSHSSQCPVQSCMNVFCWKAQRWHIRGTRDVFCVHVFVQAQEKQKSSSLVEQKSRQISSRNSPLIIF